MAAFRRLAPAGLVALSGCGLFGGGKPPPACPAAVVLQPLANTALFAPGAEPRPENVAFYGILSEVDSKCEYTREGVRVRLDVIVVGQRGPMAHGDRLDLNYFIAVVAPGERILSKKPFSVQVVFPGNAKRAGVTDHVEEVIPASAGQASQLTIDVGFQQSPEAVEFYRHFRGR
jgi:hypothetical protein